MAGVQTWVDGEFEMLKSSDFRPKLMICGLVAAQLAFSVAIALPCCEMAMTAVLASAAGSAMTGASSSSLLQAVLLSIEAVIVPPKEEIVPAIEVPTLSSPVTKEAIVAAHLTGTDGAYQSRPEVEEEISELYESRPEAHSSLPIMSCSNVKIAKKLVGTKGGLGFLLAKNG